MTQETTPWHSRPVTWGGLVCVGVGAIVARLLWITVEKVWL